MIRSKRFIIDLSLDGYDSQKHHDEACKEFVEDQLNITASSVKVTEIPSSGKSKEEIRELADSIVNEVCALNPGKMMEMLVTAMVIDGIQHGIVIAKQES